MEMRAAKTCELRRARWYHSCYAGYHRVAEVSVGVQVHVRVLAQAFEKSRDIAVFAKAEHPAHIQIRLQFSGVERVGADQPRGHSSKGGTGYFVREDIESWVYITEHRESSTQALD